MKEPKVHIKACPICGKKFIYLNKKQLEWNYNVHFDSCKRKQKRLENGEGDSKTEDK